MQKIIAIMVCWCWVVTAYAQPTISRVEYFIDNDPGFGSAIALSPAEVTNGSFSPTIGSLPVGVHVLFIRSQDNNGKWSVTNRQFFYRPSSAGSGVTPNISRVEYFIDTDPGFGNGLSVSLPPANSDFAAVSFDANLIALPTGIHTLFIRSQDANGKWSVTNSRFFYKPPSSGNGVSPNITKVEYFIDADPGFGSATDIPIAPATSLQAVSFSPSIAPLATGIHVLFIRSRDANGKWSVTNRQFFYKPAPVDNNLTQLTNVEYFIDNDPGFGKATPVVINPSFDINNFAAPVNISGLAPGDHTLFIRSRSGTGHSVTNAYTFPIAALASTPFINVNAITKKTMCARDSLKISFDAQGTYNAGNVFRVELSDPSGVFAATPPVIGTYTGTNNVIVNCQLPPHSPDGTNYRVRVSSTNPVVTGVAGADAITIHDRPYAQTITGDADVNATYSYPYSVPAFAGSAWVWIAPTAVVAQTANSANLVFNTVGLSQSIKIIETNQYGCIGDTSSKNVNVYPLKIIDVTPARLAPCPDEAITISANAYGVYYAGNTFTAQLSNASGSFASPVAIGVLNPSPQPLGNAQPIVINARLPYPLANGTNYRVRIVSSNYVITSDVSLAMVVDKPNLGVDQSRSKCPVETVDLTTVFNTTNLATSWDVANPQAVQAPGVYRLIVTNTNGCKDTALVTVINYPKPDLGADLSLNKCPVDVINLTTLFNTTSLITEWSVGTPTAVQDPGTYRLIVTNTNGCKDTAFVTITNYPKPDLGIDQSRSKCPVETVNLTMVFNTSGLTSEWDVATPTAVQVPGVYRLIVTSTNGCKDTAFVTVTNYPKPNLGPDQVVNKCAVDIIDLTILFNTASLTTSWDTPNPNAVQAPGIYRLIVTNTNGCMDTVFVTVGTNAKPDLGADKAITKYTGERVDLTTLYNITNLTAVWNTATPSAADVGTYQLIVTNNNGCKDTANVVITNYTIEYLRSIVSGNWTNKTTWEASTDNSTWTSSVAVPTLSTTNTTIQSGHTVIVTGNVSADHTVVMPGGILASGAGGALTILNNGLLLKSDANSSGMIGQCAGTITGNATIERYIPARRSWRLITAPVTSTGAPTINASWQEGVTTASANPNPNPGFGTHITGGTVGNGFDQNTGNTVSMKVYDQAANVLNQLASTLVPVTNQPGYFVFVRGGRDVNLAQGAAATATNTTLRATGGLKMGNQNNIPVAATNFTFVGNPFASPIDFSLINKNNVPNRFWVWDPKRGGANGVGQYVLFSGPAYTPLVDGGSYTGANSLIQSGQAFFVEGSGVAGSLDILESSKSATNRNVFRTNDGNDEKLQINLNLPSGTSSNLDAALALYNNDYSAAVTSEDAGKLENFDENISIVRSGKALTIEKRPLVDDKDTIYLKVWNMQERSYELEILPTHFTAPNLSAYLEDKYLHTSTPVSLFNPTQVLFNVNADAASKDANRFMIVFRSNSALPINYTSVKAYQKNDGIQVDWKLATETGMKHYEIEKSADGQQFTKQGIVIARYNNNATVSYDWFDAAPFNGNNFYRIKAVEAAGTARYSQVVNVNMAKGKSDVVISPNPVTTKAMIVELRNQPKGTYNLRMFNNLGQQVYAGKIDHAGGSSTQTIKLNRLAQAIYQLQVTNGEINVTQKVMVE